MALIDEPVRMRVRELSQDSLRWAYVLFAAEQSSIDQTIAVAHLVFWKVSNALGRCHTLDPRAQKIKEAIA